MRSIKTLLIGLAALIVLGLAFSLYYEKAKGKICEDIIVSKIPSTTGSWMATTFIRNCDAITGDTTVLNIQPTYKKFDPERGCLIFIAKGRSYALKVKWLSDTHLQLRQGFAPDNVYTALDRCLEVNVTQISSSRKEGELPAPGISVVPAQ